MEVVDTLVGLVGAVASAGAAGAADGADGAAGVAGACAAGDVVVGSCTSGGDDDALALLRFRPIYCVVTSALNTYKG